MQMQNTGERRREVEPIFDDDQTSWVAAGAVDLPSSRRVGATDRVSSSSPVSRACSLFPSRPDRTNGTDNRPAYVRVIILSMRRIFKSQVSCRLHAIRPASIEKSPLCRRIASRRPERDGDGDREEPCEFYAARDPGRPRKYANRGEISTCTTFDPRLRF